MKRLTSFLLLIGISAGTSSQTISLGPEIHLYDQNASVGANAPLVMLGSTNPGDPSIACTQFTFTLDGILCPLRKDAGTISFLLSAWNGIDKYEGPLSDPLRTRDWGAYREGASTRWPKEQTPYNIEWYSSSLFKYSAPLYNDVDGTVSSPPAPAHGRSVIWTRYFWIVGIHEVTAAEAAGIPRGIQHIQAGDLIAITHIESSPDGYPLYYNFKYSLGISYSSAADNGKKWTFYGEIIKQSADQFDDVFETDSNSLAENAGNSKKMPAFKVHNIDGGPFIIKNDSLYVYFTEFAQVSKGVLEPRLSVASAELPLVLSTIAGNSPAEAVWKNKWHKFKGGKWDQAKDALTGEGDNIAVFPPNLLPYAQTPANSDYHAWFCTHNSATDCQAFGRHLYLMTVSFTNAKTQPYLLLYSSKNGINWSNYQVVTAPARGFSQYSCFVSTNSDASDDCHIVGKEFYLMYPKIQNACDNAFYSRKITVNPEN